MDGSEHVHVTPNDRTGRRMRSKLNSPGALIRARGARRLRRVKSAAAGLACLMLMGEPVTAAPPTEPEPSSARSTVGRQLGDTGLQADGGPEFRFLRHAIFIAGDGADEPLPLTLGNAFASSDLFSTSLGDDLASIGLVQFQESAEQIEQPSDVSGLTQRSLAFDSDFDFSQFDEASAPRLSSLANETLDAPELVTAIEDVRGDYQVALKETASADVVTASTFNLATVPDVGETLVSNPTTQTIRARRRSPVAFDPRIRGYYNGQIYTSLNGAFQTPVRGDLDTILSKLDQSLIADVQVISGPYGLRYGSGFSFLNIDMIPTPRYECGPEHHMRLGTNIRTNGGQSYNTATLYGGGTRAGYYVNVGYRKGSDYEAGNGLKIPTSYDAVNFFGVFGYDIDDNTRSVIRYSHLNQADTEYGGQFFDVDHLKSNAVTHSLINKDERAGTAYRIDTWFNDTEFRGDTDLGGKRRSDFAVLQRVDSALLENPTPPTSIPAIFEGDVGGELTTAGTRAGRTIKADPRTSYGYGADIRYINQRIGEDYVLDNRNPATGSNVISTQLPRSELFEPGFYGETSFQLREYWRLATGVRVGVAHTEADRGDILSAPQSNFTDINGNIDEDLSNTHVVTSFFFSNELELDPNWGLRAGLGYAERAPNLSDRYADGMFLATIQSGFSRVIGNPSLRKERNWQMDLRLSADYEYVRARWTAYHAWIVDYVTYQANQITDPTGARLLQTVNTDLATLTGFEMYGEADLVPGIQSFASLAYQDGRDREIDQPLPGIYPLESRLGLRFSDLSPENRWGLEWGFRLVARQDRLGTLRPAQGGTHPIPLESSTPGFGTSYLRGFLRPSNRTTVTAGIENLFNKTYFEHLDLRLPASGRFGNTFVYSPGITPYFGVEVDY